jgi:hypothetical protein
MVYLFALAFNAGWGPVAFVYASEIPSNRLRAYNMSLASFTHWVMNLVVSKTTPIMLVSTPYKAYFIFGSINIVMAIVAFWIPETKGVSSLCEADMERMTKCFARSRSNVWMSSLEVRPICRISKTSELRPKSKPIRQMRWKSSTRKRKPDSNVERSRLSSAKTCTNPSELLIWYVDLADYLTRQPNPPEMASNCALDFQASVSVLGA